MNVPQRLTRVVSAALVAAALTTPTATAGPAGPDPASATVVSSTTRRCGDLLVASHRPVALPSCPGGWHFVGAATGPTPSSAPGVDAGTHHSGCRRQPTS